MLRAPLRLVLVVAAFASLHALSPSGNVSAAPQDTGSDPQGVVEDDGAKAAEKAVPADPTKSDPYALEVLAYAAWRQGGAELVPAGALESFHIDFHRVKIRRRQVLEDGTTKTETVDADALAIDWMAHEGQGDSLRTYWKFGEQQTVRVVFAPRRYYWMWDGSQVTPITQAEQPVDWDEMSRDLRLSRTLIHVALLGKLLKDGSVWRYVDDPAYPGVALHRTPPATATGQDDVSFTVWFDQKTWDPMVVRVDPIEPGASRLFYELEYHDKFPTVAGAKGNEESDRMRFPFKVVVKEARIAEQKPIEMLELVLGAVAFNTVEQKVFAPASVKNLAPPKKDGR